MKFPNTIAWTKVWIAVCVLLNGAGWILSLAGRLDATGYSVILAVALGAAIWSFRKTGFGSLRRIPLTKLKWRFRHALPAIFLLLTVLASVGGLLYSPNNYDALAYRFPRILHWLAGHRWHWIATDNVRMNLSGVGFEWLMAPLFAFTRSDRFFFLINLISFLLLPGLTYSMLVLLGVSKRVAWNWMWLFPTGYCFVLQAGSIANDSFSAVYLLAAVCFALRAGKSGRPTDLWISMMAAALMTGAKLSNLPLLLPWALAIFPALRISVKGLRVGTWREAESDPGFQPVGRRMPWTGAQAGSPGHVPADDPGSIGLGVLKLVATVLLMLAGVLASFLPLVAANIINTDCWTGEPTNRGKMNLHSPVPAFIGNTLQLASRNIMPPVMPFAKTWNAKTQHLLESAPLREVVRNYPRLSLAWSELEQEEAAGFGLGLTALLAATLVFGWRQPREESRAPLARVKSNHGVIVCVGGLMALFAYMAKMGSESAPRLVAAYYPLAAGCILLLPGAPCLIRRRWWKNFALVAALSALPVVILTPSRPLWPALTVFEKLAATHPGNRLFERAASVYSVYGTRADCLKPLRDHIPAGIQAIGLVTSDDPTTALWRPFGSRAVVDITPDAQAELSRHSRIVVASEDGVSTLSGRSVNEWLKMVHGSIIGQETVVTKISRGSQKWFVIRTAIP